MDKKIYELLVDVAESGNFTSSGERFGYTQSGVSQIIKRLEKDAGFPLFVRTRRGVETTANAERLLPLIRQLLLDHARLEQTISELNGLVSGTITIGTYSSISINWLPAIIFEFQKDFPNIDIHMKEGGIDDIEHWIENNHVDFGFCSQRETQRFDWIHLKDDPLMAILPEDHPRPESGRFPIAAFHEQPFIISASGIDHDIHLALTRAGVKPAVRFSSTDDNAIISMVANHLGISILPNLMLAGCDRAVRTLPLDPYSSRALGIGVKSLKNIAPASRKFIDYVKRIVKE